MIITYDPLEQKPLNRKKQISRRVIKVLKNLLLLNPRLLFTTNMNQSSPQLLFSGSSRQLLTATFQAWRGRVLVLKPKDIFFLFSPHQSSISLCLYYRRCTVLPKPLQCCGRKLAGQQTDVKPESDANGLCPRLWSLLACSPTLNHKCIIIIWAW